MSESERNTGVAGASKTGWSGGTGPVPASFGRFTLSENGLLDDPDDLVDILVLPETERRPARLVQKTVGVAVAFAIPRDLLRPETGVGLRHRVMDGTTVPEAAVEEDRDPLFGERDVDRPPRERQQWLWLTTTADGARISHILAFT